MRQGPAHSSSLLWRTSSKGPLLRQSVRIRTFLGLHGDKDLVEALACERNQVVRQAAHVRFRVRIKTLAQRIPNVPNVTLPPKSDVRRFSEHHAQHTVIIASHLSCLGNIFFSRPAQPLSSTRSAFEGGVRRHITVTAGAAAAAILSPDRSPAAMADDHHTFVTR